MAEVTRKTRMAVVEEVSGPKAPTAGSDYLAVQDGLSLTPGFESLESAELKAGIGASKTIVGLEQPEGSISHYVYHSGTKGIEPEMHLLIKGAFGDAIIAAAEYTVVSATAGNATTPATITVGAGLGVNFQRGQAVVVKLTDGWVIRNIDLVTGDVLDLSFNLSGVVGVAGTGLGKALLYKPHAQDTLPDLSVWDYRGNGACVQLMSGAKVSEMSMTAEAGQLVNASFSFAGKEFFFNPIEITATSNAIDFTDDGGAVSATLASPKFFKDPHDAAAALALAMTTASAGSGNQTVSVAYSDTDGKFTVSATGLVFDIDWATTVNTLGAKFGFTADDSGSTSYVSDSAIGIESPQTPALDGSDPLVAKSNSVLFGDFFDNVCFPAKSISFTIANEVVDVTEICSDSGVAEQLISARGATIELSATLDKYRAIDFKRYRANDKVKFGYSFGPKSGGSFVEGKSGVLYVPKASISAFEVADSDGYVVVNMTLTAFTESGEAEVFFNFL